MTIYLDHAATTRSAARSLEAMLPYLTETFGNPSSAHAVGRRARAALDEAHERIAARLGAEAARDRLHLRRHGGDQPRPQGGGMGRQGPRPPHRDQRGRASRRRPQPSRYLEKFGFEIVELPVDRYGRVDPDEVEAALTDRTILVSIMLANNEVGTIQPIAEIAERVRAQRGVLLHVDAVQAAP